MIGVTVFGLFLTPVFYVALMKLGRKKAPPSPAPQRPRSKREAAPLAVA